MSSLLTCLEARRLYEVAQIWSDDDMAFVADCTAEAAGDQDFCEGIDIEEEPPLFRKVPTLLRSWKDGWWSANESHEMSLCDNCNDGTGNPCQTHG